MAKRQKQTNLPATTSLLTPINLKMIGSNNDPCFGKSYDLSTKECKMCGDSELCCIKMAENLGKTRKQLESENQYKDLEDKIDIEGLKKLYKAQKKKGKSKKEIIDLFQSKYELTQKEARTLYRQFTNQ